MGTPEWVLNAGGMKKLRFSTKVSIYMGNDTRYGHTKERQQRMILK